jgi:hypothetical protein
LTFVVSAAATTTPLGVNWAEGYIRVGQSDGALSPAGDVLPIIETVITKPGSYNENVLLGTATGGSKVIMPDFSGMQITSMSLAGSEGGVGFGSVGDSDVSLQIFTSAGADQTVPGNNPATLSPNGVSSTITMTDQGSNRIVQFTPGNYTLDTSFGVTASGHGPWGGTMNMMSQNPAQMILSSLRGDTSGVFNITSGNTGAIFTTKISDAVAQPNYVTVTDLSGTGGYFRVAPSSGQGHYVSAVAGLTPTYKDGSGLPGSINLYGGTAVLSMMGGVSEIDIENQLGAAASLFAINYGVIKQSNTTGDGMHPDVK